MPVGLIVGLMSRKADVPRTTRLVGRIYPRSTLSPEQRDETALILHDFKFDRCLKDMNPATGEILFDFRGRRHNHFTAGNWAFASILSNMFATIKRAGIEYTGEFRLETTMDLIGDGPRIQYLRVENSVLYHCDPEQDSLKVVEPSLRTRFNFSASGL